MGTTEARIRYSSPNVDFVNAAVSDFVGIRAKDITSFGSFIGSGLRLGYVEKTANYTITATDYTVNCTSGSFTVTLPTAVGVSGQIYNIKNSGVGLITVATTSGQTIDGTTPPSLATLTSLTVQSTGANWIIL